MILSKNTLNHFILDISYLERLDLSFKFAIEKSMKCSKFVFDFFDLYKHKISLNYRESNIHFPD